MPLCCIYVQPGLTHKDLERQRSCLNKVCPEIQDIRIELCYYLESNRELKPEDLNIVKWLVTPMEDEPHHLSPTSGLNKITENDVLVEIGPRLSFTSPFSTNVTSIFQATGLEFIKRIERSYRYLVNSARLSPRELSDKILYGMHDRMVEMVYPSPLKSFDCDEGHHLNIDVPIIEDGISALEKVNKEEGLAFDDWDVKHYFDMFTKMGRNPTLTECYDLAQSNCEHSRHWFFKGDLSVDGIKAENSLLEMVMSTQNGSNPNNVIKFSDNSSAIVGFPVTILKPDCPETASRFVKHPDVTRHITFTAETHNFPTAVAPFSGSATGTGGRIRDMHAVGRGGYVVAGTAGYCFGNLNIREYPLPWEASDKEYPYNFAKPVDIIIEASNGASDYGNKFGEPVIAGFARSFGLVLPGGERREWIKPIMFSGGIGSMDTDMIDKLAPSLGDLVIKIGGPPYRIGLGGGAASSVQVQGSDRAHLDFNAVQRGDPEMEQKLNRVIRACLESGNNPILSIHDQGAGGNANVLKELVEPHGATIYTNRFNKGDSTMNALELWISEYQESNAILTSPKDVELLNTIARRERCPVDVVGEITGNGRVILIDEENSNKHPVDLNLEDVLGKVPSKKFYLERKDPILQPLSLPTSMKVDVALERVLSLPSVASKRYLTNKVDRSVTGLVAQQQCVGPLHTPLADCAVVALSYFDTVGSATSIGEQPIKMLIDPAAGARMSVSEALTNLAFAPITSLKDVKCSGNWMWPAKLPGEGEKLYRACEAMCSLMTNLGIAVDGGKDSLSMASKVGNEIVKSPGSLVISTYAPCVNICQIVTPDFKSPRSGRGGTILHIDLSEGHQNMGGTALAQCFGQIGSEVADVYNPDSLSTAFNIIQQLVLGQKVLAGHDISDGGVITTLLEMCFGGLCGAQVNFPNDSDPVRTLFNEEVGWLMEIRNEDTSEIVNMFQSKGINCYVLGHTYGYGPSAQILVKVNDEVCLLGKTREFFQSWERTSYILETRQCSKLCAEQEFESINFRTGPKFYIPQNIEMNPKLTDEKILAAVIREEGINGDREMTAALVSAGFEVWDVTVDDLIQRRVTLDRFKGIIFPGGFSYADVLGAGKGWGASLVLNKHVFDQCLHFRNREDTFSLGVCNGCQLMNMLNWLDDSQFTRDNCLRKPSVLLKKNDSERFESRFVTVKILDSSSIMLKGMKDMILGVWVAHGEGKIVIPKGYGAIEPALVYVDDNSNVTEMYPMNPNGSKDGIAGICSSNGRHLTIMPHPERCIFSWQWPDGKNDLRDSLHTPWLQMFTNAYNWCMQ